MESPKVLKVNLSGDYFKNNPAEFKRIVYALRYIEFFKEDSMYQISKMEKDYGSLEEKYKKRLPFDVNERINRLKEGYDFNQVFLNEILEKYKPLFRDEKIEEEVDNNQNTEYTNTAAFWYLLRDWTKEGKKERDIHYIPILNEVNKYFNDEESKKKGIKIFLPGAGLCRLAYELAKEDFKVEANDFSYFNLFCTDYLFNYVDKKDYFSFQPLLYGFRNYFEAETIFRKYTFPDEEIQKNLKNVKYGEISLTCGDFLQLYKEKKDEFDCIITCFFIDVAKNIIEYVEILHNLLKKGGIWINFGPLDYHFTNYEEYNSIDLPYSDLKEIIKGYGFEYKYEETKFVPYCKVEGFMKNQFYDCTFFTCQKM